MKLNNAVAACIPHRRSGALLIFGGVYGNRQAFAALLRIAQAEAIPPTHFVITGDVAAYCADGAYVADYCREVLAAAIIVRGNCERALAEDDEDCGCGFAPGSACQRLSVDWYAHAKKTIAPATKYWLGDLPPRADIEFCGRRLVVLHAAADADNTFIFPSSCAAEKAAQLDAVGGDAVITGHSGIPFSERLGDRLWHNSGALGMPANDGTARTWFSIWRENGSRIEIYHRSLHYRHDVAAVAMQTAGLPPGYQQTLANGIWPSDSILPAAEKARQGTALDETTLSW